MPRLGRAFSSSAPTVPKFQNQFLNSNPFQILLTRLLLPSGGLFELRQFKRDLKMEDPPWALPPAPDIDPHLRTSWAADVSMDSFHHSWPAGFNVDVPFASNSTSQLAFRANFISASSSQKFCGQLPPFWHIYPQSMDCYLAGFLTAPAHLHLQLYMFSFKRISTLPPFRHLYPQSMDCSFVGRLIASAYIYSFQRIIANVGWLGMLVALRMLLVHFNEDLSGHSQHRSMLPPILHLYPQSMDCSLVGWLTALALIYLYLCTLCSTKPISTLPPNRHLYPQLMDCSFVGRLTASAYVYAYNNMLCLKALGCFLCAGRHLSLLHAQSGACLGAAVAKGMALRALGVSAFGDIKVLWKYISPAHYRDQPLSAGPHLAAGHEQWRLILSL